MIGRNGERRSGISAQAARHDDDDDDVILNRKSFKQFQNKEIILIHNQICWFGDLTTMEDVRLPKQLFYGDLHYDKRPRTKPKKNLKNIMKNKAWPAINKLSVIWKSDLTDKMKRSFFQAAVVSILLYGSTTWTLTKRLEKKLDGNYTRMLRAILNKSWRQHPTRHQLHGHMPPITKTIQVR